MFDRKPLTHLKIVSPAEPASPLALSVTAFLRDAEARRLSARTLRFYRQQLQPFVEDLAARGIRAPQDITPIHIRAYLVSLQHRGLSDYSQHAAARSIRAFLNFLVNEGVLTESPGGQSA